MSWYYNYKPTQPIRTDEGIKARSKRGDFAENWWAQRWIASMERLTDAGRLRRGRSYARQGQVISINETKKAGEMAARVQGSRSSAYKVSIEVSPLNEREWQRVLAALAERAIFTAQLLAGEMPREIEEAFTAAGVSLFPNKSADLKTKCSCPDWANPCKHVAAVHYILGEQFDEDPFLLFRLRGKNQEEIFAALRSRRESGEETLAESSAFYSAESVPPLESVLESEDVLGAFWSLGESLERFPTYVQPPATPLPVLRRLGDPNFISGAVESLLGTTYDGVSKAALALAFQEQEPAEKPDSDPNQDENE
jgi:uncharacterized Zn finger protein